jgi:methylphosphonate synthase
MLAHVDDNDPENPAVQWNNGHFLYQFTYFVGEVNYYYEWQGKKYCTPMETGDSVFGLPYARHSFARRGSGAKGHILALTYGGRLAGDGQHELGALGEELARKYALSTGTESTARAALIRAHMEDGAYSVEYVAEVLGIPAERLAQVIAGAAPADGELLKALAEVFQIDVRELYPMLPDTENGVVIVRGREAPSWHLPSRTRPAYRIKRLACSRVTSFARSIELEPLDRLVSDHPTFLEGSHHQYGYNHGASPIAVSWYSSGRLHQTVITPDDSFYIKPFVPHRFSLLSSAKAGAGARVLLLRVGGQLVGDTRLEASVIGAESLHRLVADTTQWYDPNSEKRASSASAPEDEFYRDAR